MYMGNARGFRSSRLGVAAPAKAAAVALAVVFAATIVTGAAAHAQTFTLIHSFDGPDGALPRAGLTIDQGGKIYGTTFAGFLGFGWGSVFQLRPHDQGWIFDLIKLYDGQPFDRPVIGPNGTLYGTNSNMIVTYKDGYVWNLAPPLNICQTSRCMWDSTVLYGWTASGPAGATPLGATLLFDQSGNIYGTTSGGGSGNGVVYELTPEGVQTPIYTFAGTPDGAIPYSGVIFDSAGNLYGVTEAGGASGNGAIYELSPNGSGWSEQVIYSFTGGNDGSTPLGGLLRDASGNFYGTTITGGANGGGTVFELSPNGSGWTLSVLYSFTGGTGCGPKADLTFDSAGNLYGTTFCDGSLGFGSVFELTNSGGTWTYTSLHDFANGTDARFPISNVIFDASGRLYGTASIGGMFGEGNVWQITP
jgi:uncharacterized repeat protein (TIGR03803 family)